MIINETDVRVGNIISPAGSGIPQAVRAINCKKLDEMDQTKLFDRPVIFTSVKYYIETWFIPGYQYTASGQTIGGEYGLLSLEAVRITEEWLQLFGFQRDYMPAAVCLDGEFIDGDSIWISRSENIVVTYNDGAVYYAGRKYPCVHQFQNLYYGLTGVDLKIQYE